jgi:hypothetical protein
VLIYLSILEARRPNCLAQALAIVMLSCITSYQECVCVMVSLSLSLSLSPYKARERKRERERERESL